MKKIFTVTIGIPAYNEEVNIANLIKNLLAQKQINYRLKEIIVVSDDSKDGTDRIIKSFGKSKVRFLRNKSRIGKSMTQNKIVDLCNSDLLIMLDADILPKRDNLIENLIKPFYKDKSIGLVGGSIKPLNSRYLFDGIIKYSFILKEQLYLSFKQGNNVYMCNGRVRAFARKLYKDFRWYPMASEDAYSYFVCLEKGLRFSYVHDAEVVYRLPTNFIDHINQSYRFLGSRKFLKKYFNSTFVDKEYAFSNKTLLKIFLRFFLRNPFYFIAYLFILLCSKVFSFINPRIDSKWLISSSTKEL